MKILPAKSSVSPRVLLFALLIAIACGWWLCSEPGVAMIDGGAEARVARVEPVPSPVVATRRESLAERTGALPAYHAPVGSRLSYRFANRTGWTMVGKPELDGADDVVMTPTSSAGEQTMTMRGRMIVTVAARRDDAIIARLEFEECVLEFPQAEHSAGVDRLRRATEAPTLVHMKDTGEVVGYRFPEGLVASQCNMIRDLMTSYHFVVPDLSSERWERESTDAAGRYLAEYRRVNASRTDAVEVERTKLRYVAPAAPDAPSPECSGVARATIGRDLGWLERAEVDEKIVQRMSGIGGHVVVTVRGNMDLIDADRVDLPPLADREFDGEWAGPTATPERIAAEARADEHASWKRVLRDVTFAKLLGELEQLIANKAIDTPDAQELVEALSWLLRVREETLAEIEAATRGSTAGGELESMLMWALTKAGTPLAQDVLVSFLADPSAPVRRESAASAMIQLADPGEAVMTVLTHQVEARGGAGGADRTAMLLFGALAPHSGAATPAVQTLLGWEKSAVTRGVLPTWLEALGNAATEVVAPRAIHYLAHENAAIRRSAASALRDVHTARARDALLRVARRDAESSVRVSALESLRGHDLAAVRGRLREVAIGDRSADVRRMAVVLHAAAPEDPRTVALLRRVAKSDPEQALRDFARQLLAGAGGVSKKR